MPGTRAPSSLPYWLAGEEQCPHCFGAYAQVVEVRCTRCDGAACPHCVTRVTRTRVLCRSCVGAGKGRRRP